jgi:hypothetical protein
MNQFQLRLLTIYAGYPVWGFDVLAYEDDFDVRALVNVEFSRSRIRLSGLWWAGAIEVSV